MIMTVTNVSGRIINTPATGGYGVSPDAVGGAIADPLPYPADKSGPLAIGGHFDLPMHSEDMQYKAVPWLPMEVSRLWQQLVNAKIVTISFAADSADAFVGDGAVHQA